MSDWQALSDDELRARLAQRADAGIVAYLIAHRDEDDWTETISGLLDAAR